LGLCFYCPPIFPNLAFGDTHILSKLPVEFKFATREVKFKVHRKSEAKIAKDESHLLFSQAFQ
jgi:hypothetical protein